MGFSRAARDFASDLKRLTQPRRASHILLQGTLMKHAARPFAVIALALLAACAGSTPGYSGKRSSGKAVRMVEVSDDSFGCIRDMTPVRGFYIGNLLGNTADTLAAANHPFGGKWPAGSVVQRIPGEAMVKHGKGFNPATNDWEFFELNVSRRGTEIDERGFTGIINVFGGNCLTCHSKAEQRWDMICEQGHGCDPNPITTLMAKAIQNTDPRCPRVALPREQRAALKEFNDLLEAIKDRAPRR
jgi:hypothetical protein